MLYQSEKLYDSSRTAMENILLRQKLLSITLISVIVIICIIAVTIVLVRKNRRLRSNNSRITSDNAKLAKRIEENTVRGKYLSAMESMILLTDKLMDTYYRYGSTPGIDKGIADILAEYSDSGSAYKDKTYGTIIRLCNAMYPDLLPEIKGKYPSLKVKDLALIAGMACGLSTGTLCSIRSISEHSLNVDKSKIAKVLGTRISDYIKAHTCA